MVMKSLVFFASLRAHSDQESTAVKVQRLFDRAGFSDVVAQNDRTAIKLHFGERGNDGYISPVYVRAGSGKGESVRGQALSD